MTLRNICTKNVVTAEMGTSLYQAAKLMREHHVGNVIVIDPKKGPKIPVGILTDRDIVVSTIAFDLPPDQVLVEDVMATTLVTANMDDSIFHVLNLMKEHGIKRVPVINQEGSLESIIAADDLIAMFAMELSAVAKISDVQRKLETKRRIKIV